MKSTKLDLFGANIDLGWKPKHWQQLRKKYPCLPEKPRGVGYTQRVEREFDPGDYAIILWINDEAHANGAGLCGTVAHEASHAAKFILEHVGETTVTHETECYIVGWIASWVWAKMVAKI